MLRKIITKFDEATINDNRRNQIINDNGNFKLIDTNLFLYSFDDIVFTHALLLLNNNQTMYGYNLVDYLESTLSKLNHLKNCNFISIYTGGSDFKRRASEEFGVAISSLLMVDLFKLKWETITQLPKNKELSSFTPDFQAFDELDNMFIYESKGTTSPQYVDKTIAKAIEQVKNYPTDALSKFAIVSYFASENKTFPSYTFFADPPVNNNFVFKKSESMLFHLLYVLSFTAFTDTKAALINMLKEKIKMEAKGEKESTSFQYYSRDTSDYQHALFTLQGTYDAEKKAKENQRESIYELEGRRYFGQRLEIKKFNLEVFLGVNIDMLDNLIYKLIFNYMDYKDARLESKDEQISLFSDGTILKVTYMIRPRISMSD